VRRHPPVAVHDDLAAREPRVGLRPPDLEPPRRVDQDRDPLAVELVELAQDRVDHLGLDVRTQQGVDVDLLAVLG
jgi:hypothetical protein